MSSIITVTFRDGLTLTGAVPFPDIGSTSVCNHCGALVGQVNFAPAITSAERRVHLAFCSGHGPDYGVLARVPAISLPLHILKEEFLRLIQTIMEAPWEGHLPEFVPDFLLPRIAVAHYFTGEHYHATRLETNRNRASTV